MSQLLVTQMASASVPPPASQHGGVSSTVAADEARRQAVTAAAAAVSGEARQASQPFYAAAASLQPLSAPAVDDLPAVRDLGHALASLPPNLLRLDMPDAQFNALQSTHLSQISHLIKTGRMAFDQESVGVLRVQVAIDYCSTTELSPERRMQLEHSIRSIRVGQPLKVTEAAIFGSGGDSLFAMLLTPDLSPSQVPARFEQLLDHLDFIATLVEPPLGASAGSFFAAAKTLSRSLLQQYQVSPAALAKFLTSVLEQFARDAASWKAGFLLVRPRYAGGLLSSASAQEAVAKLRREADQRLSLRDEVHKAVQAQLLTGILSPSSSSHPVPAPSPLPAVAGPSTKTADRRAARNRKAQAAVTFAAPAAAPAVPAAAVVPTYAAVAAAPPAALPAAPAAAAVPQQPPQTRYRQVAVNPLPLLGDRHTGRLPPNAELSTWTQANGGKCFPFWRMGHCNRGATCQFVHDPAATYEMRPY